MGYREALEAAGAVVHSFEEFGSYKGDWWAKVTFNGETGWVNGSFGSCSGCDAFEAELGYDSERCDAHRWSPPDEAVNCPLCQEAVKRYAEHLIEFGRSYLVDLIYSQERAEEVASRNIEWDSDAQAMLDFIKEHA